MMYEGRPSPQDMGINPGDIEAAELAARELREFGLEAKPEHVKAITEMRNTSNFPEGYSDVIAELNSPEKLKAAMEARGLTSIVHAEGATVWDHVKGVMQGVRGLNIPDDQKRDLKLIMLYHDLGKTEVWNDKFNAERTAKHLEKGSLHVSMVGHEKAKLDRMRQGFAAEGIEGQQQERFMNVILNHMNTSLLEQDPRKTFALIEGFGATEEERRATLELLVNALYVDGNGTQKVELVGDELKSSKNEKKSTLSLDQYWAKYEEGKKMVAQDKEIVEQKRKDEELEQVVLGMKISEYLKQKGVKPGPEMGRIMAGIRGIISANKDKSPVEIRELVDKQLV